MKIYNLAEDSKIYTSNVYLITGTWNALKDVNTLIDAGRDPLIIDKIDFISTGVGKHKIDQVIFTHSHYDHTSNLPKICKEYNPKVYAFSKFSDNVSELLKDNQKIIIGDKSFEVIHSPGHSNDSVCLYCEEEGVLFAGDTPVILTSNDSTYEQGFVEAIKRLSRKGIKKIFFGHGPPLQTNCSEMIKNSLIILNRY